MSNLFGFGFDEAHKAEEVRLKLLFSSDDRGMPPTYDSMHRVPGAFFARQTILNEVSFVSPARH